MQVHGTSQLHGAQGINAPHNLRVAQTSGSSASSASASGDQLDISPAGQLAGQLSDIPEIRQDRVASIRAAIQAGTYETADKLNTAVSRLLDEIA